jgi:RNA polymerase sigma-70 factor (ECF subfamily)
MLAEARAEARDGQRPGRGKALGDLLMDCQRYLLLVANHGLDADVRGEVNPSDLVQNTFLEAKRDFAQFHGDREDELLAWLACILRHKIANATRDCRAKKRNPGRVVPLAGPGNSGPGVQDVARETPSPSDRAIAQEDLAALERARARLPEDYREVLRLRYEEDLSFPDIGARLGCSEEAARKRFVRAVDRLRKELNHQDEP